MTPYYLLSTVIDRDSGAYKLSGSLGLIHKGFEKAWMTRYPGHESSRAFAFISLDANFSDLSRASYIPREAPYEPAIGKFCSVLTKLLASLPADEDHLADAFRRNEFLGGPAERFQNYVQVGKFNGLAAFAKQGFRGPLP